jgi:uncharacterized protein YktA (UPF0223 family)
MTIVQLLELFEKDVESWTDDEILQSMHFMRTQSAKYEKELDARADKKKAKAAKATQGVTLNDILSDSLD